MSTYLIILLLIAAVCAWQLFAGLAKMRRAKANPGDPQAAMVGKFGMIQAVLGGLFLAGNILFNLPTLSAMLG